MRQQYALGRQLFNTYVNTSSPFLSKRYSSKEVCELIKSLGNAMIFLDLHSQHGCEQNAHLCIRESGWNVRWRGERNRLSGLLQVGYFKVYRQRRPMSIFIRWPHDWTPIPVHTVDVDQDYVRQSIQSIQFICNFHSSKFEISKYDLICEKFEISHFYVFTKFMIVDRECVCALSSSRRALQSGHFLARI